MPAKGWRKRQIVESNEVREMTIIKFDINRYLYLLVGEDMGLVDTWWHSPNREFDMKTPDEVYQSGPEGRKNVYDYVSDCFTDGYW